MRTALARATTLIAAILIQTIACRGDIAAPQPEGSLTLPERSIALNIDVSRATVSQLQPPSAATASVLGGALAASISNVARSSPVFGRVRVTFDLALTNLFSNIDLVPSTFPVPPTAQVVAYPFSTSPAGIFGLKVIPTTEWDGNPWNFFNDPICITLAPPGDCYRWEPFGGSIPAGSTTSPHRVGFDVDASVAAFTVYIAVAADYRERAVNPQSPIMNFSDLDPIFTATPGGGAGSRTVEVTNIGGGTLTGLSTTVSYADGATGWLSASLSETTAPATITLQPTVGGLQTGTYIARVSVASTSASNSPQSITVALIVNPAAIALSTNSITLHAGYRGQLVSRDVSVTSAGSSQISGLEVEIVGVATWLHATLNSTTTPAIITLVADPGTSVPIFDGYVAEVHVSAPGGASASAIVVMDIQPLADLTFIGTPTVTTAPGSVSVSNLTVANQGFKDAGPYNVGICLSSTPSTDSCIGQSGLTRMGLLISGTDVLPTLTITSTPLNPVPPGTYYLFAIVDPPFTAMIDESYEANNTLPLGPIVISASVP